MVSDDAGHGFYLVFDEIGSAAVVPVVQSAAKPAVVAADMPDIAKEGMYNLFVKS